MLKVVVRAWSQGYRDDGLVVIGVHTTESSFEHDIDRVRQATNVRAIDYRSRSTTTTRSGAPSTTTSALRSTSLTATASSATSTSAKDATSLLGVARDLVRVEGRGVDVWEGDFSPARYCAGDVQGERRTLDRLVADAIGRFLHGARPQAWATPQIPRRLRK
jgi:hypothetical protein